MHFEEELDPAKKSVLGVHPHSVLPWGASPPANRFGVLLGVPPASMRPRNDDANLA